MKPNLKLQNAVSLELTAAIPLTKEQISKVREISHPDNDGDSVFFDSYDGHRVLAIVNRINKNSKDYNILFLFETRSGGKLSSRTPFVAQLVEVLGSVQTPITFSCRVSFRFGRKLHPRPIISLPNKYIDMPNMPFDRIQGVHLVKLEGNESKYDVFLEAPTQSEIFENIIFQDTLTFTDVLPETILQKAIKISNSIVSIGRKDA